MQRLLVLTSFLFIFNAHSNALHKAPVTILQDNKTDTEWLRHISNGDAKKLGNYFASMINLELPSKSGDFNKNQAIILLSNFFETYPAEKVVIKQTGQSSRTNTFYIGEYSNRDQTWRLYINTHESNNKQIIHSLSIKKK